MIILEKIEKYDSGIFWLNVILLSIFINILSSSIILNTSHNIGYDVNVKNVYFILETISILASLLVILAYKKLLNLLSWYFLRKKIIYFNKYYNISLLPITILSFLVAIYFHNFPTSNYFTLPFFVVIVLNYTYLIIGHSMILYRLDNLSIKYSIFLVILVLIVSTIIIYFFIAPVSGLISDYYEIKGFVKALKSGKWGIG